jgi:hypothetical protein
MKYPGESAMLLTPTILSGENPNICVTFWYNMDGNQITVIGSLSLYVLDYNTPSTLGLVWSRSGPQGSNWLYAAVPVAIIGSSYRLVFKSQRASAFLGDIAIDDIAVFGGACPYNVQPSSTTSSTTKTTSTVNINGGWSAWSDWDDCSKCASQNGILFRYRYCNNPVPSNGGQFCIGSDYDYQPCTNFTQCST